MHCPKCGSTNVFLRVEPDNGYVIHCNNCNNHDIYFIKSVVDAFYDWFDHDENEETESK